MGAAAALSQTDLLGGGDIRFSEACRERAVTGEPFNVTPSDETFTRAGEATRVVEYVFNTTTRGGSLDLCTSVGHVKVVPSEDDQVRLTFTLDAHGSGSVDAVNSMQLGARFAKDNGQLNIAGWQSTRAETGGWFNRHATEAIISLAVPASGPYAVAAVADVGFVAVEDLIVTDLDMRTDVGEVDITNVHVQGNVTLATDVGDINARFLSMQTGEYRMSTDVGQINVHFPARNDTGYDLVATTDVGHIDIDDFSGGTVRSSDSGPGGRVEARSADYESRLVKISIRASTDVGDITIRTE